MKQHRRKLSPEAIIRDPDLRSLIDEHARHLLLGTNAGQIPVNAEFERLKLIFGDKHLGNRITAHDAKRLVGRLSLEELRQLFLASKLDAHKEVISEVIRLKSEMENLPEKRGADLARRKGAGQHAESRFAKGPNDATQPKKPVLKK